ncbi:MAG TPA: hypothetical protein PK668_21085 [Myxococcota bacterium]|nr:hypothetical protein [Myxococcota bacterium]HRY95970.1 hypothetical protein [Myxococcota bacterium]HSA22964.1 hypothetical protein [Myxococcota bacterium]
MPPPTPRQGVSQAIDGWPADLPPQDPACLAALEELNVLSRALIAGGYNYAPCSGHPGGSISASRILEGLLYAGLEHDLSAPDRPEADRLVLAAGHKALLLYVALALRDELARLGCPELLPPSQAHRLRLEDLLGFRRNPTHAAPLFRAFGARALDGHPTPATPFVPVATGASGVGVAAAVGLALGLLDTYPDDPPRVHALDGEGGLTPGRVHEALAAAACAGLWNLVLHVDWNQASIDSERVCGDERGPGDYVPWSPAELFRLHDWHVLEVADGLDFRQVLAAQARLRALWADGHPRRPTAIIYRTQKGWRYPLRGRASHGAGPACCSPAFWESLAELEGLLGHALPRARPEPADAGALEAAWWELLGEVRAHLHSRAAALESLTRGLRAAHARLAARGRSPRPDAPSLDAALEPGRTRAEAPPPGLTPAPGGRASLRETLGDALAELNRRGAGALLVASADLGQSTSVARAAAGFPPGFFQAGRNPGARLVATGGICEDAMTAILAAAGAAGRHLGVAASYAAFLAPLGHVSARLHAIGELARREALGAPMRPLLMVCAHAGLKTGEDGPTHADPQALQLLQNNFPPGALVSLVPWRPEEIWPCLVTALQARPAVVACFVTRPAELTLDGRALGLPPPEASTRGVVAIRRADPAARPYHGSLVLVGAGVTQGFAAEVLPRMDAAGLRMNVFSVVSPELFDRLSAAEQDELFPPARAEEAVGLTDFTAPVLWRWVTGAAGRKASRHAFSTGRYPGSGQAGRVLAEVGLDPEGQWRLVQAWAARRATGG